jgi:hypothetical protein
LEPAGELDILAFEFFREFVRCEYCLKAVGFLENTRNPRASWVAFSREIEDLLDTPGPPELKSAIEYLIKHPPKKQIVRDNCLEWSQELPQHKSQSELVLLLVCRIRNNLFHGGKFNGRWFEPQRSMELLVHGLVVLRACVEKHPKVREAYAQRAV